MHIILLTHERELVKKTNTGRLVLDGFPSCCEQLVWQRKNPPQRILDLAENGRLALLYPSSELTEHDASAAPAEIKDFDGFVLLDATWQQARKMMNQSPYLRGLPRVCLKSSHPSRYQLRKNQKTQGLCTAECVIEIWREKGELAHAERLNEAFEQFNNPRSH